MAVLSSITLGLGALRKGRIRDSHPVATGLNLSPFESSNKIDEKRFAMRHKNHQVLVNIYLYTCAQLI